MYVNTLSMTNYGFSVGDENATGAKFDRSAGYVTLLLQALELWRVR